MDEQSERHLAVMRLLLKDEAWMDVSRDDLQGRTPRQALNDDDLEAVVDAAKALVVEIRKD